MSLPQLREAIPARYPIRHYPDITHSRQCQYPVPDWDLAYATTEPRGDQSAAAGPGHDLPPAAAATRSAFSPTPKAATTTSTRSSGAGWAGIPKPPVIDILREYGRYFIGDA